MKNEIETKSESGTEATTEPKKARRELFGSGLAAASAMFGLVAAACSDDDDSPTKINPADGGRDASTGGSTMNDGGIKSMDSSVPVTDAGAGTDKDIGTLNGLLKAEWLAIEAYNRGAAAIGAAPSTDPLYSLAAGITAVAVGIQAQHKLHAQALSAAITGLGGTPVDQATTAATLVLDKGLTDNPTITNVLKFAARKEREAAIAYNQSITGLEAAKYRFLGTAIEGDESQHFIVLAALVLGLAGPGPNLAANTGKVFPAAFVHGFDANVGLDTVPANYFA